MACVKLFHVKKFYVTIALIFINIANAFGLLDMTKYYVSPGYCVANNPLTVSTFSHYFGQLPLPVVDDELGLINISYPYSITKENDYIAYSVEGTLGHDSGNVGETCSFCPYQQISELLTPEIFQLGGFRYPFVPMYGPCFNRERSKRINCVQNQLLHPPEFVGEYFFPEQRNILPPSSGQEAPVHDYLRGESNVDSSGQKKEPTYYGIGKGRVISQLDSMTFSSTETGASERFKTEFQKNYVNLNGIEQWLKWAQHFCSPSCHRNSERLVVQIRKSDFENKSKALYFLSIKPDASSDYNLIVQCRKCPTSHASYIWRSGPVSLGYYFLANECHPWFGSIPNLISKGGSWEFNTTNVQHGASIDGIVNPTSSQYKESIQCPVNTYNDVCAHTIQQQKLAGGSEYKVECKSCPAGYHTGGKMGSWYCLPPPGNLLVNRNLLLSVVDSENSNHSLLWSRRDYLGYEFECGWLPAHCLQCSNSTGTAGMFPDEFNQKMILNHVLAVEKCQSGFYCPDPLKDNVACPSEFPWSPPGSSSIQNCTCKRGSYFNSVSKLCESCGDRTTCQSGQYMQGWYNCMYKDGATSGGICKSCANKPQNSNYRGGSGMEVDNTGNVMGICSFNCLNGYTLTTITQKGGPCFDEYSCIPLQPRFNTNGNMLYSPNLYDLLDNFSATASSSGDRCTVSGGLSNAVKTVDWVVASSTCSAVNPSICNGIACTVSVDASFYRNFECQPCPSAPTNGHYTVDAMVGNTDIAQRKKLCSVQCDVPYYANGSKCENCSVLDSRYCQPGYHIKGQGCLGDYSLFPSNLSENCYKCNYESAPPGSYIDYGSNRLCSIKTCSTAAITSGFYRSSLCGGTNPGSISPCTQSCPIGQYLSGTCTELTTGICTNCTVYKPGYYIIDHGQCGTSADAIWAQCVSPNYCSGSGSMTLCPNSKISSVEASSPLGCFCPAGTFEDTFGFCIPFQCPNSVLSMYGPGVGYNSSFYMELNSEFKTTCYPCDANISNAVAQSFSIGNGGVGFSSCRCPVDTYGTIVTTGGIASLSCVSCTTSNSQCSSNSFTVASNTCWSGGNRDSVSACICVLPPFTKKVYTACNYDACESPFEQKSIASSTSASEQSLGSSLYVINDDAKKGWSILYPTNKFDNNIGLNEPGSIVDFNITKLKVTSNKNGDYALNGIQYALWAIREPSRSLTIWTAPLNPSSLLSQIQYYNSYYSNSKQWTPVCGSISGFSLEDVAVAKWPVGLTQSSVFGGSSTPTLVAALLKYTQSGVTSFSLYLNLLSVGLDYNVKWDLNGGSCGTVDGRPPINIVNVPSYSTIHSLSHAYAVPSGQGQAFYVAYNVPSATKSLSQCHVKAVGVTAAGSFNGDQVIDLSSSTGRQITALAIIVNPSSAGVLMYVAFDDLRNRIRLIKWSTGDTSTSSRDLLIGTESDELFFPNNGDILSLSVLWANGLPIFLAKAKLDSSNTALIYTADNIQRTLTEVQGMTYSTHPSLGPLGVELESNGRGLMVASSGSNIFFIPINQCTPSATNNNIPRYWNGKSCVEHVCVRPRSCTVNDGSQTWDPFSLRCVCSPGYFKSDTAASGLLSCTSCPAKNDIFGSGYFCQNNSKISCPNNLPNNIEKAKSPADCSCADGYYFSGDSCALCPVGKWCPNKWDKLDCPGDAGVQTGGGGAVYPTSCTCSTGHVGPNCLLCPEGRVCLAQISNLVKNLALQLNVNLYNYDTTRQLTNQIIEDDICNDILVNNFFKIFLNGGIDYLKRPDSLRLRYYCKFIPASYHSNSMFIIMIQLNNADDSANNVGGSMRSSLLLYNSSYMTISSILPVTGTSMVPNIVNNTEAVCPSGKVPNDVRTLCICAPGYASSSTSLCTQCTSGFYKSNAGFGTCISCPVGTTSKVASSFCFSNIDVSGTSTQSAVNNNNLPIIVGGVIGGVILVGLLIFGMARITSSH